MTLAPASSAGKLKVPTFPVIDTENGPAVACPMFLTVKDIDEKFSITRSGSNVGPGGGGGGGCGVIRDGTVFRW